jgi:hypothetical protein
VTLKTGDSITLDPNRTESGNLPDHEPIQVSQITPSQVSVVELPNIGNGCKPFTLKNNGAETIPRITIAWKTAR